ncbi:MAG: MoxR family ATPase [Burkholderiales bacterium]|nr:MoxR family ATPase [Phycisphaerae bacterium]
MAATAIDRLRTNVQTVFLGNTRAVDLLLIGLLARGHVLIEDVPGVGKTLLAKALAKSIACDFSRIQLTPDLLPGDVLGVSVFNRDRSEFEFKPGPIFTNILLADEINRTTPRTQSALLEAMSEEQVSVENHTYQLKRPFMVVATQNPFEFEGTYHLPENQLDRFMLKVGIGYPARANEHLILTTQPSRTLIDGLKPVMSAAEVVQMQDAVPNIRIDTSIVDYVLDLAEATRHHEQLHLGISTRGALALTTAVQAAAVLHGREYALPDDVKDLFIASCAHRVISKTYLGNGDADATTRILQSILDRTPTPK